MIERNPSTANSGYQKSVKGRILEAGLVATFNHGGVDSYATIGARTATA